MWTYLQIIVTPSEATHLLRRSFHLWKQCWKCSSVGLFSLSVTDLWILPIRSKWWPLVWFSWVLRIKESHTGWQVVSLVVLEPLQCLLPRNSHRDSKVSQSALLWCNSQMFAMSGWTWRNLFCSWCWKRFQYKARLPIYP